MLSTHHVNVTGQTRHIYSYKSIYISTITDIASRIVIESRIYTNNSLTVWVRNMTDWVSQFKMLKKLKRLSLLLIIVGVVFILFIVDPNSWIQRMSVLAFILFGVFILNRVFLSQEEFFEKHKQMEETLRDSEERYRRLVEDSPDPIAVHCNGKFVYINDSALQFFGGEETRDIIGRKIIDFVHPDDLGKVLKRSEDTLKTGNRMTLEEVRILRLNGEVFFAETTGSRISYSGKPAIQVIARDITYRKEAALALEENEKRLRSLINAMPDFVLFKDGEGRWKEVNEFGRRLFELETTPYYGLTDRDLAEKSVFFKEALLYCIESDERAWLSGSTFRCEEVIPQPDGHSLVFDVIKVPLFYPDGERKALVTIGRDITERKLAEQRLEESEQRYKSLFDQNADMVCWVDIDGVIQSVNTTTEQLTGSSKDEMINRNLKDLFPEHEKEKVVDNFKKSLQGEQQEYESDFYLSNGSTLLLEIKNIPIVVDGEIVGVFAVLLDVTEQKKSKELIIRSEKLSVLGELAAGVAHEIRNPLTSLKGFLQLLKQNEKSNTFYYDIMLSEMERINFIVSEFLVLSKPQAHHYVEKNVEELLSDVIKLLEPQSNLTNVGIKAEFETSLPSIWVEENQVKQVFINLIKNAIEAMPQGGDVQLKVKGTSDKGINIQIIDSGEGIPDHVISRLGEPFYTTKEKGTGLGLMISQKIISDHEGQITFNSEIDRGTTVSIYLPYMIKDRVG